MDITTIKLRKSTKSVLDRFRKEKESYDMIIRKLAYAAKQKNLKQQMIEAYKSMGSKDLEILEEWEAASQELRYD